MDQMISRTDPLGFTESFEYDLNGNLVKFTDRKGQITQLTYDGLNRRIQTDFTNGSSTQFEYDTVGNLVQIEDSISGKIQRGYDNLNRLIEEITPQGVVTYNYDSISRRTSMSINGLTSIAYEYDVASRLTQVAQGSLIVNLSYDASDRGNSISYPNGTTTDYFYDISSSLTKILHTGPSGVIEDLQYAYDSSGNRIGFTRIGAQTDPPTDVQAAYNTANQLIQFNSETLTYDENGNLVDDGTYSYNWDAQNRLVGMNGPGTSASFDYDAFGRRVSKTINSMTTDYHYDGFDIIAEIGDGAIEATYLRGLRIDEPFVRIGNNNEYYHTDALGSTLALTDDTGFPQTTYSYDPFGNTVITGESTNPFQYTGRENDGTGVYYYRFRYYDPHLHRFISEDPIRFYGGDVNLYSYVKNSPLNWGDPSGLCPVCVVVIPPIVTAGIQVGTIVGGIIAGAIIGDVILDSIHESRGKENKRDTGLIGQTDDEIKRKARDKSLSKDERRRYQTEEKAKKLRNKQKRQKKKQSGSFLVPLIKNGDGQQDDGSDGGGDTLGGRKK